MNELRSTMKALVFSVLVALLFFAIANIFGAKALSRLLGFLSFLCVFILPPLFRTYFIKPSIKNK